MDVLQFFSDYWYVIIFIVSLIFTLGRMVQNMKTFVNKNDLEEAVKKGLLGHCPFADEIEQLQIGRKKSHNDIVNVHTKLHQIDFNVQNICEKLEVTYIGKKNGS